MKVLIKVLNPLCKPEAKCDWIDLKSASDCLVTPPTISGKTVKFTKYLIPLGVCMELPYGFEAHVVPRSSTFKQYGILMNNSFAVIDNTYCGNEDEWKFPALFIEEREIKIGDRVCQFRIMPSQFAPWYIKLKWMFVHRIKLVYVDNLSKPSRGGIGSTGK